MLFFLGPESSSCYPEIVVTPSSPQSNHALPTTCKDSQATADDPNSPSKQSKVITSLTPRSTMKRMSNTSQNSQQQKMLNHKVNDRKAMKTLTFLLGAFIVCWTPWNIAEVINGIWGHETVNYHLYQVRLMLLFRHL